jgi:hypothetical protein
MNLVARGRCVTSVDSLTLISRLPEQWIVADIRSLSLGRRVDGVAVWDSFFHLDCSPTFVGTVAFRSQRRRPVQSTIRTSAHDFGNGRAGKGFYEQLLSAVRAAGSPEAIKEFETRFSPFLNPHQKHLNAGDVGHLEGITDPEVTAAVQDRPRSEWGTLYLAAFLGAFIIGLTVIGMTATEQSTMTAATIPRAKAAESASGTTTQPMQVVGVKALEPEQRPVLLNRHTNGTESVNPRYFPKKAKFVSKKPMFIKMAPFGLMATISISMGLC